MITDENNLREIEFIPFDDTKTTRIITRTVLPHKYSDKEILKRSLSWKSNNNDNNNNIKKIKMIEIESPQSCCPCVEDVDKDP